MRSGSDFCDTCTKLANIAMTTVDVTAKQALTASRNKHSRKPEWNFLITSTCKRLRSKHQRSYTLYLNLLKKRCYLIYIDNWVRCTLLRVSSLSFLEFMSAITAARISTGYRKVIGLG
eukprot:IDg4920t1